MSEGGWEGGRLSATLAALGGIELGCVRWYCVVGHVRWVNFSMPHTLVLDADPYPLWEPAAFLLP